MPVGRKQLTWTHKRGNNGVKNGLKSSRVGRRKDYKIKEKINNKQSKGNNKERDEEAQEWRHNNNTQWTRISRTLKAGGHRT